MVDASQKRLVLFAVVLTVCLVMVLILSGLLTIKQAESTVPGLGAQVGGEQFYHRGIKRPGDSKTLCIPDAQRHRNAHSIYIAQGHTNVGRQQE